MQSKNINALAGDQGEWVIADVAHRIDGKGRPHEATPRLVKGEAARQARRRSIGEKNHFPVLDAYDATVIGIKYTC